MPRKPLDQSIKDTIIRLFSAGLNANVIAAHVGVSRATVFRVAAAKGIRHPAGMGGPKSRKNGRVGFSAGIDDDFDDGRL